MVSGRSGTGKSNFVRAVRFLRDALNVRTFRFQDDLGGNLNVDHRNEPIEFEIHFRINSLDSDFEYHAGFDIKTKDRKSVV